MSPNYNGRNGGTLTNTELAPKGSTTGVGLVEARPACHVLEMLTLLLQNRIGSSRSC